MGLVDVSLLGKERRKKGDAMLGGGSLYDDIRTQSQATKTAGIDSPTYKNATPNTHFPLPKLRIPQRILQYHLLNSRKHQSYIRRIRRLH